MFSPAAGAVLIAGAVFAAAAALLLFRAFGRAKEEADFLRRLGTLDAAEQSALRRIATLDYRAVSDAEPDVLAAVQTKAGFLWTEPKSASFTSYHVEERWATRLRTWASQRTALTLGFATNMVPTKFDGTDVVAGFNLAVTNHGSADEFQAEVVACGPGENTVVLPPIALRWIGGNSESRVIDPGVTEYLEIAHLERSAADSRIRNEAGQGVRGFVTVGAYWDSQGHLGGRRPYWASEDFAAQTWSLHIVVSSTNTTDRTTAGVRLHLFGRAKDDPIGQLVEDEGSAHRHPTARMTLFDVTPRS